MGEGGIVLKVLVTGGGGFLGLGVCRALVEAGYEVTSFSRGGYPALEGIGIGTIRGDLGDRGTVLKAVKGMDAVVHTAAKVGFWGKYEDFHRTNVLGTENVVAACRKNGTSNLVFTSSPSVVFGGKDIEGADESIPYPPFHGAFYNRTKAESERFVLSSNGEELRTVALRPHLIFGPGDDRLVPRLVQAARYGRLRRIGSGKNIVDTVYIDNASEAHVLALKALESNPGARGRAFFITNGEPRNAWEMIDRLLSVAGAPAIRGSVPKGVAMAGAGLLELSHRILRRKGEPMVTRFLLDELTTSHWFDISAAKKELGYVPMISIDEGIRRYGEYLKEHPI
jgi:nucleoside-diphosphate-sugar epimerase